MIGVSANLANATDASAHTYIQSAANNQGATKPVPRRYTQMSFGNQNQVCLLCMHRILVYGAPRQRGGGHYKQRAAFVGPHDGLPYPHHQPVGSMSPLHPAGEGQEGQECLLFRGNPRNTQEG